MHIFMRYFFLISDNHCEIVFINIFFKKENKNLFTARVL